jgi:hypothetical protein
MLRLYSTKDWESLKRDKWGIPDAGAERKDIKESTPREDCELNVRMHGTNANITNRYGRR